MGTDALRMPVGLWGIKVRSRLNHYIPGFAEGDVDFPEESPGMVMHGVYICLVPSSLANPRLQMGGLPI